jgi:hypothetical protein
MNFVARMERSAIRESRRVFGVPDFAALHPGYETYFPSPLVGEGGASRSEATGEGSVPADRDPSSDPRFARITFSHKGRREEVRPIV